jgi:hypothetical protein
MNLHYIEAKEEQISCLLKNIVSVDLLYYQGMKRFRK